MARILITSLLFAPDGVSTAQLLAELASDLQADGHDVSVVAAKPHYNRDEVAEAAQPLTPIWGGLFYRSNYRGIPVIHTAMPRRRASYWARLPGWMLFHVLALVACLFLVERPAVVVVPSPMLTAGVIGWFLARLRGASFVYYVLELYPELAVKGGQLRNPLTIALLRALEGFVYRHATAVTAIGQGMRRAVIARGVPEARVHFIPVFVDTEGLRPGPKDNAFAREHGLTQRFVVTYAGNMGFSQGLEGLLDVAEILKDERDILFLFVGGGVLQQRLEDSARLRSLHNTRFVAHQPYQRVPEIYAASDLCVVSLLGAVGPEALPSKLLRIMACGRPVLAMVDGESEVAREVLASRAGVVVPPSSPPDVAVAVRSLKAAPVRCATMGAEGRAYVRARYARDVVTAQYSALISRLTPRPTPRTGHSGKRR